MFAYTRLQWRLVFLEMDMWKFDRKKNTEKYNCSIRKNNLLLNFPATFIGCTVSRDTQTWIELASYTKLSETHKGQFSFRETGLLSFISHVFAYRIKRRCQIFLNSSIATGIKFPFNFLFSKEKTQRSIKRLPAQPWVTRMANLDISLTFRVSKYLIFRLLVSKSFIPLIYFFNKLAVVLLSRDICSKGALHNTGADFIPVRDDINTVFT